MQHSNFLDLIGWSAGQCAAAFQGFTERVTIEVVAIALVSLCVVAIRLAARR